MSGLQISKGTDDIQKFGELIPLIPKFCRYLSACAFKKALLLVSPLNCGVRADLSVDDNSRSPFIVLALVENMFAEFTFVDIEMKRPTESLSHLYAQALVDLELLRQYFVLQIRTASLMGRKKGAKLVSNNLYCYVIINEFYKLFFFPLLDVNARCGAAREETLHFGDFHC